MPCFPIQSPPKPARNMQCILSARDLSSVQEEVEVDSAGDGRIRTTIKIFAGSSTQSPTCQRLRPQSVHLIEKIAEFCDSQDSCHSMEKNMESGQVDSGHEARETQVDMGIDTADSVTYHDSEQDNNINSNTDGSIKSLESRKRQERNRLQKLALSNSARRRRRDEENKSYDAQVYLHTSLLHLCLVYLTIITGRFSFSTSTCPQSEDYPDPASISFYLHFRKKASQKYNICIMDEETYGQFCEVKLTGLEHFVLVEACDIFHLLAYEAKAFFYDLLISTSKRIEGASKCDLVKSGTGGNTGDFALLSLESALLILVSLRVALMECDFELHTSTDILMRNVLGQIKGKQRQSDSRRLVMETF